MKMDLGPIRPGLFLVLVGLMFGIGSGVAFGLFEDSFKDYVVTGIADNPGVHDAKSPDKIWRYAQRGHFHAAGIAAFSIGLLFLVLFSNMRRSMKSLTSLLVGLGSLYPFA